MSRRSVLLNTVSCIFLNIFVFNKDQPTEILLEGKENLDNINNTSILDATNNYLIGTEILDSHLFLCTPDVMAFTLIVHLKFFFISNEYSFIPRYIRTYICNICIPSDCIFFHLMCRREYREKTWKTYIYIFLINFIINNILSEILLTNVRCFLLELCLTRKVWRETGGFVALFFFLEEMAKYACLLWSGLNNIYLVYLVFCS